mmetsp:Transcript_9369/g.18264  ORF Transcript_9369/g.18264 Transcript_9369/m.18264 type:complete len:226 (-) Transcript_9369:1920-2597(-)
MISNRGLTMNFMNPTLPFAIACGVLVLRSIPRDLAKPKSASWSPWLKNSSCISAHHFLCRGRGLEGWLMSAHFMSSFMIIKRPSASLHISSMILRASSLMPCGSVLGRRIFASISACPFALISDSSLIFPMGADSAVALVLVDWVELSLSSGMLNFAAVSFHLASKSEMNCLWCSRSVIRIISIIIYRSAWYCCGVRPLMKLYCGIFKIAKASEAWKLSRTDLSL